MLLAELYDEGRLVPRSADIANQLRATARILEEDSAWCDTVRAAEQGNFHRYLGVARALASGEHAIKWYLRAAQSDDSWLKREAYTELAEVYAGHRGIPQDRERAKQYLRLAANEGSSQAKAQLDAIEAQEANERLSRVDRIRLRIRVLSIPKLIGLLLLIGAVSAVVMIYTRSLFESDPLPAALGLSGLQYEVVVAPSELQQRGWSRIDKLQITTSGVMLLQSGPMIYEALSGMRMLSQDMPDLKDFCVVADSIVAVRGDWLSYYEDGDLIRSVRLPSDDLRIAGNGETNVVYVYGNSAAGGDVYAVFAGGTYGKLMHLDQPIRSVAAAGQRLFVSAGAKVLTWKEGEEPAAIVDIGDVPITSLAFDAANRILYFTSGEGVFAQKDHAIFLALAGVSGELLFENDTLFVSDAGQGAVVAVKGLAAALGSHQS